MWLFFKSCGKVFIGEKLKPSGKMIVCLCCLALSHQTVGDFELSLPALSLLLTWDPEEQRGTSCSSRL